jgi:hypothetical protein
MQRTIYLPAIPVTVSLGAYIKAVKTAIRHPDAEFKHGLTCWWPCTGRDIRKQFLKGVHDRITQGVPYLSRGIAPAK